MAGSVHWKTFEVNDQNLPTNPGGLAMLHSIL